VPGRKAPEEQRRAEILHAAFAVAARERLTGVTARAVAAEAGVSSGLVFFYFESVDALLVALLDDLLHRTLEATQLAPALPQGAPSERLLTRLRQDLEQLPRHRTSVELFFDYWVLGTRNPAIRRRIRLALDHYRNSFLPLAAAVVGTGGDRWAGQSADGLAGVAASFVEGCALQAVLDPTRFDVGRSMATLAALIPSGTSTPA
jgi:AcrR family transcriptional regulator